MGVALTGTIVAVGVPGTASGTVVRSVGATVASGSSVAAAAGPAAAVTMAVVGVGVGVGPVAAVGSGSVGRSFGPDHRVTTTGYAYDGAGNLTADPAGVTYTYDAANRLTSTTRPATATGAGLTVTYRYDALGNRVQQTKTTTPATGSTDTASTVTSDLLVDESGALPVVLGDLRSDNTASFYIHGPEGSTMRRDDPDTATGTALMSTVLLGDTHGSLRATTDTAGAVTATASYDPDGNPRTTSTGPGTGAAGLPGVVPGTGGPGYMGEWTGPDGTIDLRARAYAPALGLFLQADTHPGTQARPLSQNPYTAFENNPVTYTDPTGHAIDFGASSGGGEKFAHYRYGDSIVEAGNGVAVRLKVDVWTNVTEWEFGDSVYNKSLGDVEAVVDVVEFRPDNVSACPNFDTKGDSRGFYSYRGRRRADVDMKVTLYHGGNDLIPTAEPARKSVRVRDVTQVSVGVQSNRTGTPIVLQQATARARVSVGTDVFDMYLDPHIWFPGSGLEDSGLHLLAGGNAKSRM